MSGMLCRCAMLLLWYVRQVSPNTRPSAHPRLSLIAEEMCCDMMF